MSPLTKLQSILQSNDGFLISERGKKGTKLCNGVFGSKAGTPLMTAWKKVIDGYINRHEQPHHGDLGFRCLSELLHTNAKLFSNYMIFDGDQTMYPVAWFESQDIFLSDITTTTSAIEREFQPLIILLSSVYNNYKGLYAQQGKECVLDLLIQTSLNNLINDYNLNVDHSIEDMKAFEYDRERLIRMAHTFIRR